MERLEASLTCWRVNDDDYNGCADRLTACIIVPSAQQSDPRAGRPFEETCAPISYDHGAEVIFTRLTCCWGKRHVKLPV